MLPFITATGIYIALCVFAAFVLVLASFHVVPEGYATVTEFLGSRNRVLFRGPHLLVPFLERRKQLTWTTFTPAGHGTRRASLVPLIPQTLDPEPIPVVTRGRVVVEVDLTLRWRVRDPAIAAYMSQDLTADLFEQLRSGLADVVARVSVDELADKPSSVAEGVRLAMTTFCKDTAVEVVDLLVQGIRWPREIEAATHLQVAKRIEADAQLAAQKNQQLLLTAKTRHDSELRVIENEALLARSRANLEAAKLEAEAALARSDAVAEGEKRKLAAIVGSGVPVPPDFLSVERYAVAWQALASAPGIQKIVIPTGAVPFLGSTGVLDVREWVQKPHDK